MTSHPSQKFHADLARANTVEAGVMTFLCGALGLVGEPHSGSSGDFKFSGFIEVKEDRRCAQTGNLFFELARWKGGPPSGISVSKAVLVVHIGGERGMGTIYLYSPGTMVRHLKHQLAANDPAYRESNGAGDGNSYGIYANQDSIACLPFVGECQRGPNMRVRMVRAAMMAWQHWEKL